ncbi:MULTISPECIES: hypothetical protein [unclassified Streptomyces]|uniref:hypothetical protein n=1 Tax=unclassified Streptomyces TaxID=2593676 RepID=UPI002E15FF0B|nr:hypothetical protein OG299_35915 [Streptomyces sp. NBC_01296]
MSMLPPPRSGSRTGRAIGIVAARVAGLIVAGFAASGTYGRFEDPAGSRRKMTA